MCCPRCGSDTQKEFAASVNVCFGGLQNIHIPGFRISPSILVCLKCGFSGFTIPEAELVLLCSTVAALA
jgi:hypothetical protein